MGDEAQSEGQTVDTGAAKPKAPGRDPVLTERDQLLARMDAQIEQKRKDENEEFLRSSDADPQAWLLHKQMQAEARGQPLETETPPETNEEPVVEDGADSVEEMYEAAPAKVPPKVVAEEPAQRISQKGEDPLGDYVVRVNGKPMFKMLVNGRERLMPLEAARAQLQKEQSANDRYQAAADLRKNIEAREANLRKAEADFAARSRTPAARAPVTDDGALDNEAIEIVRSLVTEPEDKAAARLAKTLKTIRQAPAPQIDVDAITKRAADAAAQRFDERETHKAFKEGFRAFEKDYRDVAGNPELFAMADRKTDAIAAEHPEWSPGQVMLEAGRQTREWMQSLGLVSATPAPANGQQPSNRQQRKEGLRPMPTPRTARPAAAQSETTDRQAPSEVVAEMRKARGQPY